MRGFTIIEMLVYIAIFTFAMGAVSGLLIYFYRSNTYVLQKSYAINSARKGIETMSREIREATYSDVGAYPVIEAQSQSFSFYSDIDRDENVEKVRYFLDGTNFKKGETKASGQPLVYDEADEVISIISDNVRNGAESIFTYYNASSTEVADLGEIADIKLIKTTLIVDVNPVKAPENFTLTTSAQIRNLYEY